MIRVTHESPEYNEKDRTGLFYAQSWLLTHMLMLHDTYGRAFGKFVAETSTTGSAEEAIQRVFGKSIAEVDRDLMDYYRSNSLKGVLFDTKLQKIQVADPRPATELEIGLTLAKLTGLLRRHVDAERRFLDLAKAHPDNSEVYEALGYLSWQEGELLKAKQHLKHAVDLKPTSWKIYWDYARLAQGDSTVLDALRSALRINPSLVDARLMLGFELYKSKQYNEAYVILSQVKSVTPERAASLFLVLAYSALEIGNKAEAKKAADLGKKYAKTALDIAQADSILEFIERPGQPVRVERMMAPADQSDETGG
jgi:tetratricopeptide (TPR) repeat protein